MITEIEESYECDVCGGDGRVTVCDKIYTERGTKWERSADYHVTTDCDECQGNGRRYPSITVEEVLKAVLTGKLTAEYPARDGGTKRIEYRRETNRVVVTCETDKGVSRSSCSLTSQFMLGVVVNAYNEA